MSNVFQSGQIVSVTLGTDRQLGTMKNPNPQDEKAKDIPFTVTAMPNSDPTLIEALDKADITYQVSPLPSPVGNFVLAYGLPLLLIGGIYYLGYRLMAKSGMGTGDGGVFGVGQSKAKAVQPETIGITYKDVGGADEAIMVIARLTSDQDKNQVVKL